MSVHLHRKQSSEVYAISIDYTDRLPNGVTLATADVTATDPAGADVTSDHIGTVTVTSPVVAITLKAATPAYNRFYVHCLASNAGETVMLDEEVAVLIEEK